MSRAMKTRLPTSLSDCPATYAAVRASFAAIKQARPDFAPKTALDIGAGPGTALWAAANCWPDLADALLVEASPVFRTCGEALAREASVPHIAWRIVDVAADTIDCPPRDLVTLAYALNELAPEVRQGGVEEAERSSSSNRERRPVGSASSPRGPS